MIHIENVVRDLLTLHDEHEAELNELKEAISSLETRLDSTIESEQEWKTIYSQLYFKVSKLCPECLL